jgi:hypothetical protein
MDTVTIGAELRASVETLAASHKHALGNWESFLGDAIQITTCTICFRFAWAQIFPNGNDDQGNQIYKTDIRGSAVTMQCGSRKVS